MFKSILPSKRIPDSEFTMITTATDPTFNGKENHPALTVTTNVPKPRQEKEKTKKSKGKAQPLSTGDVEYEFTRLMVRLLLTAFCRVRMY